MAMHKCYKWNELLEGWYISQKYSSIVTQKYIYQNYEPEIENGVTKEIQCDPVVYPILKIYITVAKDQPLGEITESKYYYVENYEGFSFTPTQEYAILMDNNYGYQENGSTLFNNEDGGVTTKGVVNVINIPGNVDATQPRFSGRPEKSSQTEEYDNNEKKIGEHNGQSVYKSIVNGYLLGDKQFEGFRYESDSTPGNYHGVKNNKNIEVNTKGWGINNREPVVLWENFYSFINPRDNSFYFRVTDGYISGYWYDEKGVYHKLDSIFVGDNAKLGLYVKKQEKKITSNFKQTDLQAYFSGTTPVITGHGLTSNNSYFLGTSEDCRIQILHTWGERDGKYDFGLSPEIEITSNIYRVSNNLFSKYIGSSDLTYWSTDLLLTKCDNIVKEEETEVLVIGESKTPKGQHDLYDGKDETFVECDEWKSIYTTWIKYYGGAGGSSTWYQNEISNLDARYVDKMNYEKERSKKFTTIKIYPKTLSFLSHIPAQILSEKPSGRYICRNDWGPGNYSSTYGEYVYDVVLNYDWGMNAMTSVIKDRDDTYRLIVDDGEYSHIDIKYDYNVHNQRYYSVTSSREVFLSTSIEIENGNTHSGLFYGLRCSQPNNNFTFEDSQESYRGGSMRPPKYQWGDRFCITLEWDDETNE